MNVIPQYKSLDVYDDDRYTVTFSPAAGLWGRERHDMDETMEFRLHKCSIGKDTDVQGIGIELAVGGALPFTSYTYLDNEAARALGEALAFITGCAWHDPEKE